MSFGGMPITWYVASGGGAVAVDTSEPDAVSAVAVNPGGLCAAVSVAGKLVVFACPIGISAVVRLGELCAAASVAGKLVVFACAVGISAVVNVDEFCAAISTGGELVVVASAVAGVGAVATDTPLGCCVTARITTTSTTPVNSAINPEENRFARGACAGSGGGTVAGFGGAPQEGQAVANELTSFPQS